MPPPIPNLPAYQSWLEIAAQQIGDWLQSPPDAREPTDLRSLNTAILALRRIIDIQCLLAEMKEESDDREKERERIKSDEDGPGEVFVSMEPNDFDPTAAGDEREMSARPGPVRGVLLSKRLPPSPQSPPQASHHPPSEQNVSSPTSPSRRHRRRPRPARGRKVQLHLPHLSDSRPPVQNRFLHRPHLRHAPSGRDSPCQPLHCPSLQ